VELVQAVLGPALVCYGDGARNGCVTGQTSCLVGLFE
jgi:hypothetical protein